MAVEDVEVPGITAPAESPQEQQPAQEGPPAPEMVPFQYKGEERQIPSSHLDAVATALGTSRDAALMWLQQGKDYGQHVQESRQKERELAQWQAYLEAETEKFKAQHQQTQQPPPGWAASQQARPGGPPQTDDPIALLRWQAERVAALEASQQQIMQRQQEEREFYQQQIQERELEQTAQVANEAYKQVAGEFEGKYPYLKGKLPSHDDIVNECYESGMAFNRRLPIAEAYRRATRNLLWDQGLTAAGHQALQQARNPQGRVTLPAASGQASAAPQKPKSDIEAALEKMTMAEASAFLPDAR